MSKKSETIEIRVSYEMKQRLAQKAQAQGDTMSGLLRQLASDHCNGAFAAPSGGQNLKGWTMTKTLQISALTLVCGAAMATAGLFATQNAAMADPLGAEEFAQMDFNDDGILTHAEYDLAIQVETMRAAGPAEDALSEPEWPAACKADFARLHAEHGTDEEFAALDQDGDGKVTEAQYSAALLKAEHAQFDEMDRDGDGLLSFDEYAADPGEAVAESLLGLSPECVAALDAEEASAGSDETDLAEAELDLAESDIKAEFIASDIDGDGFLDRREYLNL